MSAQFSSRKALHSALEAEMLRALQSDFGIEIKTSDPDRLRQELNFCRRAAREHGESCYDFLVFRSCPTDPSQYVWIIRKISVEDTPKTNPSAENDNA